MNSIAVWWEKKQKEDSKIGLHLDINLWRSNETDNNSIEFGVKISDSNEEVFLMDFPFEFEKCQFHDLIPYLSKDAEISKILFNENIILETTNGIFTTVKFNGSGVRYTLLHGRYTIAKNDGRTRLSINLPKAPDQDLPLYFRFTIDLTKSIYETKDENYFYLDGIFRKVALLDLNINCLRKLPAEIAEKLVGIKIRSINMFLITSNIISFDFVSKTISKSRILERDIWNKYRQLPYKEKVAGCDTLPTHSKPIFEDKEVVAYHWKEIAEPIEEYSIFAKFTFSRKKVVALIAFIFLVVFLGGIGGILGNLVTTKIFNNFQDDNTSTISQEKQ